MFLFPFFHSSICFFLFLPFSFSSSFICASFFLCFSSSLRLLFFLTLFLLSYLMFVCPRITPMCFFTVLFFSSSFFMSYFLLPLPYSSSVFSSSSSPGLFHFDCFFSEIYDVMFILCCLLGNHFIVERNYIRDV